MPCIVSLRLVGVQVGQARQAGQPLVPLGIVLHRAGAQRIEVRVDRHVERREVDEVPHQFRLGQLRQRRRRGGQRLGRQQFRDGPARHVALGEPDRRGSRAWKARTAVWSHACFA